MNKIDLKKIAFMGITSSLIAASQAQAEDSANRGTNNPYLATDANKQKQPQQNDDPISQGYSNQGYFNNQDLGRSSNYYFQQNQRRQRNKSNSNPDDYNDQNQNDNQSNRRYNDRDQGYDRGDRNRVANNNLTYETPPDSLNGSSDEEDSFQETPYVNSSPNSNWQR